MRILVIRRDNIGDLVCTTPLFHALRVRYPEAHIGALVNSYNAAVLDGNPDVDEVYAYTKLKHRLPGQSRLGILAARLGMLVRLRAERLDYVVLAKSGFDRHGLNLARQLKRKDVVGFVPTGGHAPRALTVPVAPVPYDELHEVEVMQRLGTALDIHDAPGPLCIYPNRERRNAWCKRLPALESPDRPWVAVHISARQASRVWPAAKWVELVRRVTANGAAGVVLLWAPGAADDARHPGDDAKARQVLAETGALAAPTAELAELIAMLSLCHAFIGADGGAMHIAAALGLPMVAIFENVERKKRHWHPWRVPHELVAPELTLDQVLQAWERLCQRTALGARIRAPTA